MKRVVVLLAPALLAAETAHAQDYRFPIEPPGSGTAPYVTAYRDLSAGAGVQDWNCGSNAYNGHRGTDIGIGGFPVMDAGSRWVVAAADGDVTTAVDGCFDRCTSGRCDCGGGFGNYVKITHADGKSTYYGHLMQGSLQVAVGDRVSCGQRLGKVGSSGNSTGPHLHFEPRYSNNVSDDPFRGNCGGPVTFWVDQGAYNALPGTTCAAGSTMPPPDVAVVKGVVWDRSVTDTPSAPGNLRVPGTRVEVDGGSTTTARAVDAFWEVELAPGTYRLVYTAAGYEAAEQMLTVTAGETRWASIGLAPEGGAPPARDDALLLEAPMLVEVAPSESFDVAFVVENTGNTTWSVGEVELAFTAGYRFGLPETHALEPGEAIAPGAQKTWRLVLTASTSTGAFDGAWRMIRAGVGFGPMLELTALVVTATVPVENPEDPEDPEDPVGVEDPGSNPPVVDAVKASGKKIQGGCGCTSASRPRRRAHAGVLLLLLLAVARRRTMLDSRDEAGCPSMRTRGGWTKRWRSRAPGSGPSGRTPPSAA